MRKSSICHPTPTANRALPLHQKGRMWDAGCDGLGQTSCRGAITCPATSQKQPTPSLASPPYGSMPGPAQLEVLRLKVVLATEADVRQALRSKGFTRTRVSQLWTECLQSPPRRWAQRELQSAQDQPHCNHDASKELNSTNDAPSIIYPDSIIDAFQEILLRRSYRWSRTKNHTRWINADHDVSPLPKLHQMADCHHVYHKLGYTPICERSDHVFLDSCSCLLNLAIQRFHQDDNFGTFCQEFIGNPPVEGEL